MSSTGVVKQKESAALKQQAMKYYQENQVPKQMEQVLNSMFYDNPSDIYGYLVNFFGQFTKPITISKLKAHPVLDSNGQTGIQVDVFCTVQNLQKHMSTSLISRANIRHSQEDSEKLELHIKESIEAAINLINSELSAKLLDMEPTAQEDIEQEVLNFMNADKEDEQKETNESKVNIVSSQLLADDKHKGNISSSQQLTLDKYKKQRSKKQIGKASGTLVALPDRPAEVFQPGSEVVVAVSQAVCACAAVSLGCPIFQHVAKLARPGVSVNELQIPLPMVTMMQSHRLLNGKLIYTREFMLVPSTVMPVDQGIHHIEQIYQHLSKLTSAKHGHQVRLVNEVGALCPSLDSISHGLEMLQEAVNSQGLKLGEDLFVAINGAGHESFDHERGKYELMAGQFKSPDDMVDVWTELVLNYPSILAIIDPIRYEDTDQWLRLCEKISEKVLVIGDGYFQRPGLLRHMELPPQASGLVLRLEMMNTVSDMIACANKFLETQREIVLSTNISDTPDTFIVDLAVGLNVRFLKIGGPCRGERTAKLNRLLQIKQLLASSAMLPPKTVLTESAALFTAESEPEFVGRSVSQASSLYDSSASHKQLKDQPGKAQLFVLKPHPPFMFPHIKKTSSEGEDMLEVIQH